ncbi:hypothetical protein C8Q74DRAFT_1366261 [Fomes fomentarius]|nr:hypothetical protein C8Q74DRAFT_1366261 [Fomes fomentarius]
MAPPALQPSSLYCILFSRGDGTFHWTICASVDASNAVKMHATNVQGGWVYEKKMHNVIKSQTACIAVKIGELSSSADIERVSSILENIPMSIPSVDQSIEHRFTCRVWFKEAARVLTTNGIISCSDVAGLEREIKGYGEEQDEKTISGHPLVICKSSIASV